MAKKSQIYLEKLEQINLQQVEEIVPLPNSHVGCDKQSQMLTRGNYQAGVVQVPAT